MSTDTHSGAAPAPRMHPWQQCLPDDAADALLVGRMDFGAGPTPVLLHQGEVQDLSAAAATVSQLLEALDSGSVPCGQRMGGIGEIAAHPRTSVLAPLDLQCIKASGVTFAVSALERVIEERAGGDAQRADAIRRALSERIGGDLRSVKPGSAQAQQLRTALQADGLWSQYLEVAIGPDAEIFTKAPVLSAVGAGADVGIRSDSGWNNPEPEVVLVCDSQGRIRGATLGNDVNLRDIEGRSALLLGKAKDNNASCAVGPFIRLFDAGFTLDDVRQCTVRLDLLGADGFTLDGESSMRQISRDPQELVEQTIGKNHRYPDGFALFLGTMFAPVKDRGEPGKGFTHQIGDIVRIASPRLGRLENRVVHCEQAPPWSFGVAALMRNLAGRGLLA
ncbi:fumarylacetoacetate hydrolase family protein [Verminephrobacter aporrectodeae]|uniref:fumarylacetoacetate hydrolase family protein n=1 Tax=Verminephrobacter aporrectodeae TaxID=1110389 RepID=UPI0022448B30|nr:fumarylacetoacetate hydrolase family protein [Verminephrobacter aporrectodeae]MCW8176753.1 fumarylacetoacetate hydrolase [Verminephrobacter aporrectodeae subsp. tuberculatae]MCW8204498.1 fumarylacetoacetate hydrolase [Verminephrobacter aporrectodeae subsp. tuberculatae]